MADRDQAADRLLANPTFLADLSRRSMNLAFAMAGVCAVFGGYVAYKETRPDRTRFFATNADHDPIPMTPLDEPVMPNPAVVEWAKDAALAAYNMDFWNYSRQSQAALANFLPHAWNGWRASFVEKGNLDRLRKDGMVAIAGAHRPAIVTREAVVEGRRTWRVEFPIDLAFVNSNGGVPERRWVTVVVTRTEDPKYPRRVAISQLVDRPWTEPSRWGLGVAAR